MKKKMLILFIIGFMFIGLFNFGSFTVVAATYQYGFENTPLTEQVSLAQSGFFGTATLGSGVYVDDGRVYSGSKSYLLGNNDKFIWFNFSGGNRFTNGSMWINADSYDNVRYFEWRLANGTVIIEFKFDSSTLYFNSATQGYVYMGVVPADSWFYLSWNINSDDNVTYYTDVTGEVKGAPRTVISDPIIDDFLVSGTMDSDWWIDVLSMPTTAVTPEGRPTVTSIGILTDGVDGVQDVQLGSTVIYTVTVSGDENSKAHIRIDTPTGFPLKIATLDVGKHLLSVTYPYPFGNGTYKFYAMDWYEQFSDYGNYDVEYSFTVYNDSLLDNISEEYGDFFVEFMNRDKKCYYGVNDNPEIVVNVNDTLTDAYDFYLLDIVNDEAEIVYTKRMYVSGTLSKIELIGGYKFDRAGSYYLALWNVSADSPGLGVRSSMLHGTYGMEVCSQSDADDYDVADDEDVDPFIGVPDEYMILLGVMISFGLGLGFYVMTHEVLAFGAGFAIPIWLFSQEAMGSYNLVPVELGYGIIVVLVLVGAIVWLLD